MVRHSRFLFAALVASFTTAWLNAQAPVAAPAAAASTALPPELQAELDALQRGAWFPSGSARASIGWRDNILLSPFAPIDRGFARGEVEAMLFRPRREAWEFVTFVNGDLLRYLSPPPETKGETQWALHAEARWQPVETARFSLKAAGYYRDMVIDLSEAEARRVVAPTQMQGAYVVASSRVVLPAGFSVEPSVQVKRSDYRKYAGDYDEGRGGARVEWKRSRALAVSAGWFETRRHYLHRTEYRNGAPVPGTQLRLVQREADVRVRTAWQGGGDWNAALSLGDSDNRDGASQYFDYDQQRVRLELGWRREGWRVNFDGDARRLEYRTQTVGAGIAPPPRLSEDYDTSLRVERELNDRWALFGEYRWERSRSNEPGFSYRVNTMLAGVQRTF